MFAETPIWDEIVSLFAGTFNDQQLWGPPQKEQYVETKLHWLPELPVQGEDRNFRGPWTGMPKSESL